MGSHYKGSLKSNPQHLLPESHDGKVTIKPEALDIIWGNDPRYWRLPSANDSTVELLQVCWLEVTGSYPLSKLSEGEHKVTFEVSMKPDAFGWSDSPVYLMAKVGDKRTWRKADLSQLGSNKTGIPRDSELKFQVPRATQGDEKVTIGLYEIWRGRWKGGLVIHQVTIQKT